MVAGEGLEPTTSGSWAGRATNCSIPRYMLSFRVLRYYTTTVSGLQVFFLIFFLFFCFFWKWWIWRRKNTKFNAEKGESKYLTDRWFGVNTKRQSQKGICSFSALPYVLWVNSFFWDCRSKTKERRTSDCRSFQMGEVFAVCCVVSTWEQLSAEFSVCRCI